MNANVVGKVNNTNISRKVGRVNRTYNWPSYVELNNSSSSRSVGRVNRSYNWPSYVELNNSSSSRNVGRVNRSYNSSSYSGPKEAMFMNSAQYFDADEIAVILKYYDQPPEMTSIESNHEFKILKQSNFAKGDYKRYKNYLLMRVGLELRTHNYPRSQIKVGEQIPTYGKPLVKNAYYRYKGGKSKTRRNQMRKRSTRKNRG